MRWALSSLLCLACTDSGSDSGSPHSDTGRLEMGSIAGVVTRTAETQGDGIGHLVILGFYNMEPMVDYYPSNAIVLPYTDLSESSAEVSYSLTHLFPEPSPYYVAAVFDQDNSIMESGSWIPTSGDLLSAPFEPNTHDPVYVDSGTVMHVDIILNTIYQE